jgi:hypothetical protein
VAGVAGILATALLVRAWLRRGRYGNFVLEGDDARMV